MAVAGMAVDAMGAAMVVVATAAKDIARCCRSQRSPSPAGSRRSLKRRCRRRTRRRRRTLDGWRTRSCTGSRPAEGAVQLAMGPTEEAGVEVG